jgi:hypothetical protein
LFTAVLSGAALAAASAAETASAAKIWKTGGFVDRIDGTLGDGGANIYVAADGSVRLINLNDLNRDGNIDLVAPTDHSQSDGQVDMSIFWGKSGLSPKNVIRLPSDRGKALAAADLNGDGFVDLVLANAGSNAWRPIDTGQAAFIYWGSARGYSAENRTNVPTEDACGVAVADIDGDGSLDLVFANIGNTISADHFLKSFVYWGDHGKFDAARRAELPTEKATDAKVADVDGDGLLDVVITQEGNLPGNGGVTVFYGGGRDRAALGRRTTRLPGDSSSSLAIADLNADGRPDLVVANEYRSKGRESNGVYSIANDVLLDSYIYWGTADGYSDAHRTALPTHKATGVAVADLNGDGRPDLVFANSSGGVGYGSYTDAARGGGEAYVFWNGPAGFARNHLQQLPTVAGSACAIGDLNGDGYPDIVFANSGGSNGLDTLSYIYWGGPQGYSAARRAELPTFSPSGVLIADLDGDGKPEVAFANSYCNTSPGNRNSQRLYWGNGKGEFTEKNMQKLSLGAGYLGAGSYSAVDVDADGYVDLTFAGISPTTYWGGPKGFSVDNRTVASNQYSFYCTFGDLNRDGWLDVVCAEFYPGSTESRVYFGGPTGFAPTRRFAFKVNGPRGITLADFNKDGWPDVAFATSTDSNMLSLFWGGPDGFDNDRKTLLPVGMAPASRAADLNNDGWLDLVVANLYDPRTPPGPGEKMHAFGGSTYGNALIYWGGPQGFAADRRQVLRAIGLEDVTVADFNKDGYLDFAASHYSGSVDRKHPSYVFWNGPEGFSDDKVTLLPTFAASGVMSADFNNDGYRDIRFANHVKDSDHNRSNFIYWGGPKGFDPARRAEVYDPGPHLLSGQDIGNVYDRSDRYDYISTPFDAGQASTFEKIAWTGEAPFATKLEFQVRTAATQEELLRAPWSGPAGPKSFYTKSGEALPSGTARWIQYKATLVSPNDADTPILRDVSISYR